MVAAGGALGAVAVGRLVVRSAGIRQLKVGELEIDLLRVRRLEVLERDGSA